MSKKSASTVFLRVVVWLLALLVLALCVFALPAGLRSNHVGGYRLILLGMYIPAIPFFIAVHQILRLLDLIDRNRAFSAASIRALTTIKYAALTIGALYGAGLPYIFYMAQKDDAPGVVLLGLIFTFGPLAVAALAGVLQKLFESAIPIKSENDLTV